MRRLKVGVVGCGFITKKRHIPSFLRLKRKVVVQAVCDLDQPLVSLVAKEFSIHGVYSNLSEMLQKEDLDIVDICTPPQTHTPLAIEAIENGCHVLLEKPMALTVYDCDQMINVARRYDSKLCIIHNEIFHPPLLKARELVKKGDIGELTGMRWCRLTHRAEYMPLKDHWIHKLPGGLLGETGPHAVYTSLAFLKNVKNVEICARKTMEYPWAPYDYFGIGLDGENMMSSIVISHSNDCFVADVDLFGTKGVLKVDLLSMLLIRYEQNELRLVPVALSSLHTVAQTVKGVTSNALKAIFGRQKLGHDILIEKFVDSVINDQQPPVTAGEGRETVRTMEMIVRKLHEKHSGSRSSWRMDDDGCGKEIIE